MAQLSKFSSKLYTTHGQCYSITRPHEITLEVEARRLDGVASRANKERQNVDDFSSLTSRGYQLRERIGAGGFGAVYRGYQSSVKREVAIKIILPQHANNP